jgi:ribosome-binding protein aMBF1 (putative translation factor)
MKKTRRDITARKEWKASTRPRDGVDLLESMIRNDRELRELADQAILNAMVAQLMYEARNQAGLTQGKLAKLVGTRQSVVSRMEDANSQGHSLTTLRRIAEVLGKRLDVRFVDDGSRADT